MPLALANCALLACSEHRKIEQQLASRGFEPVVHSNSDDPATADTQACVAVRPDALVVAFRGTEPTKPRDFATDFDAGQVPFETKFGFRVGAGP